MSDMHSTGAPRDLTRTRVELSFREQEDRDDADVLAILSNRENHNGLWSIAELARHRKSLLGTEDAVKRLLQAGLVQRHDEFIFPTRAATRYSQLTP